MRQLLGGDADRLELAIASAVVKPALGMPVYEVSGECGAVGPLASQAPKKSYVITLYQSTYWAAPA
ncbi:hypothetical protein GCM10017687_38950 [Streptomyces echinatus]